MQQTKAIHAGSSRRQFLKDSTGAVAGATLASLATAVYAGEDNTIKIALVGCGGRGTGAAAQAMSTAGPVKLVAMADVFPDRMEGSYNTLAKQYGVKMDVPAERKFIGLDGYRKAIDLLGGSDLVLLTTPPAFRPIHVEYAVQKGVNVFMEKSFGVDAPGVRRIMAAGKLAEQKNLKIAGGLMSRHSQKLEAAVEQIHKGLIGEVITCWSYREHGPVGFRKRIAGESELAHQIRNYSNFTWVNGSFLLDWLIHNLDIACWVKDAWPVSAQGQGGRQTRVFPDQLFDHYAVEYSFPDGTRMLAQGRHMDNCWSMWGDHIQGATGCAVLGEGVPDPKIYKGYKFDKANLIWEHKGEAPNAYQLEHDLLFEAIRKNQPYNEADRCCKAAMVGIMGRMAAETGAMITWDQAMSSNQELAPGLDNLTWESPAPVMPDADGRYPVAMPGKTRLT
jgi:predicted dehydrogenase